MSWTILISLTGKPTIWVSKQDWAWGLLRTDSNAGVIPNDFTTWVMQDKEEGRGGTEGKLSVLPVKVKTLTHDGRSEMPVLHHQLPSMLSMGNCASSYSTHHHYRHNDYNHHNDHMMMKVVSTTWKMDKTEPISVLFVFLRASQIAYLTLFMLNQNNFNIGIFQKILNDIFQHQQYRYQYLYRNLSKICYRYWSISIFSKKKIIWFSIQKNYLQSIFCIFIVFTGKNAR